MTDSNNDMTDRAAIRAKQITFAVFDPKVDAVSIEFFIMVQKAGVPCVDASYLKDYVLRAAFKDTNSLDYERSVFIGRSLFAKDSVMCSRYVMTVEIFEAARNKSKGKTGTSKAGTRARTPRRK